MNGKENGFDPEAVEKAKSDGQPYADQFEENYEKGTPEERRTADSIIATLTDLLGPDEDN